MRWNWDGCAEGSGRVFAHRIQPRPTARRFRSMRDCGIGARRSANTAAGPVERMEQLAILARWFYSSWCDGELLLVDDWAKDPVPQAGQRGIENRARATAASSEHSFLATVLAARETPGAAPMQWRDMP